MNNKVNIMIASIYEREECLIDTINSLIPQLKKEDTINLFLQRYIDSPKVLKLKNKFKNINIIYDWEYRNLQANEINFAELGIFLFENIKGYVFICDDDLIYPKTYIKDTIERYKFYNKENKTIVSYHGKIIKKRPIANYYHDTYNYNCLATVNKDVECEILGTGVICYHTDIFNFQMNSNELQKYSIYMRDIHISLEALSRNIKLICLNHSNLYFTYNEKMKGKETIFDTFVNNPIIQTKTINDYKYELNLYKLFKKEYNPLVNIIVINSRQLTHPQYIKECFDSIREQSYNNIKPIIVSNYQKLMTIGKCWNEAIKQCTGEWIFFLGDDDMITNDYIQSLITEYNSYPESDYKNKIVMLSSFCTIFRDSGEYERKDIIPTGMWKRDYLLKYPFKEFLTKLVDSSYMDATKERGDIMHIVEHQYGLYYRSHTEQVSGIKALNGEPTSQVSDKITNQLMKMNLEK